jgi:hypothetical protein
MGHPLIKQQLEPGGTVDCAVCGAALLLVSGPPVTLWCHGRMMRPTRPVRCSERLVSWDSAGLTAGTEYLDPAVFTTLRCTRSGSGWPVSRAGALVPACADQRRPA